MFGILLNGTRLERIENTFLFQSPSLKDLQGYFFSFVVGSSSLVSCAMKDIMMIV